MSFLRWALFIVPLILVLGFFSGQISGSGEENRWFQALVKPALQPPGWLFGLMWTLLYFLMAVAVSLILHARGAPYRGLAVILFLIQLALNLFWSPLFFGMHQVSAAFWLILMLLVAAASTSWIFFRIRKLAGWLMVPYLVWLCFAAFLNQRIDSLNPNAETLVVPVVRTQI